MSLVFGIFNRDGKPVDQDDLNLMYEAVNHLPHEKYNFKIIDNIAFGHLLTYNTPESIYEQLPKWLPEQKLFFTAQGRLDNRLELCDVLNIRSNETLPDGDIILQAWLRWGQQTADKLIGDWAFAVFDFDKQELFVSRDHHGYTAMNYYLDKDVVVFASSIKSLIALKQVPKILNERKLLRNLAIWSGDDDQSYYKNINILPPANNLKIDKDKFSINRYWFPENIQTNYDKKLDDYIEEFNNIFTKAVSDRLRSYKPVASMLSGGLDSGAVSFVAAELLKKEEKTLTTYSHIPLYQPSQLINKNRFGDEKPYIESTVAASGNINPIYLNSKDISPLDGILQLSEIMNGPIHAACNAYWLIDILASTAKDGFGVLLTGEHGNATISFSGLIEQLSWQKYSAILGLRKAIRKKVIRPAVYRYLGPISKKIKEIRGRSLNDYSYINQEYIEKIKLESLMLESGHDSTFFSDFNSSKEYLLKILQPGANLRCYFGGIFSQNFGIEQRDPTADKRVIEYILTIPNEMFFDNKGENKQILRKMMDKRLPDKVLYTNNKGLQSGDIGMRVINEHKRFDEIISTMVKSDKVKEMIDTNRLKNDWEKIKKTNSNNYDPSIIHNLLRTIMTGNFINSF